MSIQNIEDAVRFLATLKPPPDDCPCDFCEVRRLRARVTELEVGLQDIATMDPDEETQIGKGLYASTVQVKARQLLGIA